MNELDFDDDVTGQIERAMRDAISIAFFAAWVAINVWEHVR